MPCAGPRNFSHIDYYVYDFCPLSDPYVGTSVFVCDVDYTFSFCSGQQVVLRLFGECPDICTRCQLAAHMSWTPVSSGRWR